MPDAQLTAFPVSQAEIDALVWNGERLFQAAKFGTEMQYQHLVFEEFARKIQPNVDEFLAPEGFATQLDPAILAEFAHVVYRFGHSMLLDNDRPARSELRLQRDRTDRGVPQPARLQRGRHAERRRGGRRHRARHHAPGRQRDRRVQDRGAAQQPARPAARPCIHQPRPRPRHGDPVAQRGAARVPRVDPGQPAQALRELDRLHAGDRAPRVARQLHRRLRHARDHHRPDHACRQACGGHGHRPRGAAGHRPRRHPGQWG